MKALKEQKAALETFQKAVQAVDSKEGPGPAYKAAVAALPGAVYDAIIADLKGQCGAQFTNGREKHQGFAETMLNTLHNITYILSEGSSKNTVAEVAIYASVFVQAAVTNVLAGIDTKLAK